MLEKLSRDPPPKSSSTVDSQLIPDPWEAPSPTLETKSVPYSWQPPTEAHQLIPPAGIPGARLLPPPLNPVQVLLQDELKLKVATGGKLKAQMEKALALLCWMGMATQEVPDWQMI